ncbi:MAG: chromosome partitioning protein ParB, partial [Lachnospiraceae bacterium]|nr:chromosome partitioning protein ParB [Lachnospiraceae bacterium]
MAGLNKSKGLNKGKGLKKLIDTNVEKPSINEKVKGSIVMVNISKVEPNKNQPRTYFDEDALN